MAVGEVEVSNLLKMVDAWRTGHFLLSSGLHSREYVQCQKAMQYPRYGMVLARAMVARLKQEGLVIDTVVGPALGAIHWELMVAMALEEAAPEKPVKAIFAERQAGADQFQIRRGVDLRPDDSVLVVEDVTTTGGSALKVVELLRSLGVQPLAVGTIVDRGSSKDVFDIPFVPLVEVQIQTYGRDDCPMCKEGIPVEKPGSSKETT